MYVNPFWFGVFSTILCEVIVSIIFIVIAASNSGDTK